MPEDERSRHIKEKLKSMGDGTAKDVHAALQPTPYSIREVEIELDRLVQSEPGECEKIGDKYRWTKSYRFQVGKP